MSKRRRRNGLRRCDSKLVDFWNDCECTLDRINELTGRRRERAMRYADVIDGMLEYSRDSRRVTDKMDAALGRLMEAVEDCFYRPTLEQAASILFRLAASLRTDHAGTHKLEQA